jgi:hypothetical protein
MEYIKAGGLQGNAICRAMRSCVGFAVFNIVFATVAEGGNRACVCCLIPWIDSSFQMQSR